jgi:hypothetical protein
VSQTREVFGELICEYPHPNGGERVAKIRLDEWWPSPQQYAALKAENERLRGREAALEQWVEDRLRSMEHDHPAAEEARALLGEGGES